jgi:DhnA family fructose-bisphosphate aldolase class Ia
VLLAVWGALGLGLEVTLGRDWVALMASGDEAAAADGEAVAAAVSAWAQTEEPIIKEVATVALSAMCAACRPCAWCWLRRAKV